MTCSLIHGGHRLYSSTAVSMQILVGSARLMCLEPALISSSPRSSLLPRQRAMGVGLLPTSAYTFPAASCHATIPLLPQQPLTLTGWWAISAVVTCSSGVSADAPTAFTRVAGNQEVRAARYDWVK